MKKIALLFPGQGSQYVGMGKKFYKKSTKAMKIFEQANDILGFDIKKLCFEGPMDELTKTENTQPAILTCSVAAYKMYIEEIGLNPFIYAGHSLGEISALTCAGAIEFQDALRIVRARGLFMQEASASGVGSMTAVFGMQKDILEEECRLCSTTSEQVVIANYNSFEQIVVSGHKSAVVRLGEKIEKMGARIVPLKVSAPFHSPLIQEAADKMSNELMKYSFNEPKYPVLSNINALPYEGKEVIINNLAIQMVKSVRWQESMAYLERDNIEITVEIGPGNVLTNLAKKNISNIKAFSFDKEESWIDIKKECNLENEKKFKHTVITKCIEIAICTRNRNWDNEEYQKGVVEPYRMIKTIQEELEESCKDPTIEQMDQAIKMLYSVLSTKKVPIKEQRDRFDEVLSVTETKHLFESLINSFYI